MLLDKGPNGRNDHIVGPNQRLVRRRANAREMAMRVGLISGVFEAIVSLILVVWPLAAAGNHDEDAHTITFLWIVSFIVTGLVADGLYLSYQRLALRRDLAACRITTVPAALVQHYLDRAKDRRVPREIALEMIDEYPEVFQRIHAERLFEKWQSRDGIGGSSWNAGRRINEQLAPVVTAAKRRHREQLKAARLERLAIEAGYKKELELTPRRKT